MFDESLRHLSADVTDTLVSLSAIGITAPHVGVPARLYVLKLPEWPGPRVYVNARVSWHSSETASHPEGSVSMPGIVEEVERPARVRVDYQTLDGTPATEEADGFLAACHQHEIDQLDGIFWLRRLSALRRDRVIRKFDKLLRHGV